MGCGVCLLAVVCGCLDFFRGLWFCALLVFFVFVDCAFLRMACRVILFDILGCYAMFFIISSMARFGRSMFECWCVTSCFVFLLACVLVMGSCVHFVWWFVYDVIDPRVIPLGFGVAVLLGSFFVSLLVCVGGYLRDIVGWNFHSLVDLCYFM